MDYKESEEPKIKGTESAIEVGLSTIMALGDAPSRAASSNEVCRSSDGLSRGIMASRASTSAEEVSKGTNPVKGFVKPKHRGPGTTSGARSACEGTGAKEPPTLTSGKQVPVGGGRAQKVNPIGVNPCVMPSTSGPPTGDRVLGLTSHPTGRRQSCAKRRRRALRQQKQVSEASVPATGTQGASKRARELSGESPGTTGDPKKVKCQGSSYREALSGIRMAVIDDGHPTSKLGAELLNPIREVMWEMLESTPDPLPHVNSGKWIAGAVHFTCEGENAVKWLCRLNGKVVGKTRLRVVSAKDLPKPVKMAWKSRNTWCADTTKVLGMLQRFNPALHTAEWKVIGTQVEEGHVRRIVYMDKASAEVIKTGNYTLQAGMDKRSFKLLDDSKGKSGEPTERPAEPVPTEAPRGQEGPQEGPCTEERAAASPTSSGRTDDLLGGLDVTGLLLSPQPEVMSADEETDEEDAGGDQ